MKAVKFVDANKIEIVDVNRPACGDNEAIVEVKSQGICMADIKLFHARSVFAEGEIDLSPYIPGHEPSGVVVEVGRNVSNVKPGDRVLVYMMFGCGECEYCNSGHIYMCKEYGALGFQRDGGQADYLATPADNCLKLPDDISFVQSAVIADVGGTLYTACKLTNVCGRDTVAVFGAGPMGSGGIMMAKACGAKVISIDLNRERNLFASDIGADLVLNPSDCDVVEAIKDYTDGKGADVAIDCTGNAIAEKNALECVRPFGRVNFVGENMHCEINPSEDILRKMITITGSWIYPRGDWEEITSFIRRKKIPLQRIATHLFKLEDAQKAYEMFEKGLTQKVVFVWDGYEK